jgi:F-type H+-transporting ATPase subunit epsilon
LASEFPVSVLTAEGELLSTEAELVVATAASGEIGILDRHVPLLALLKPGSLRVVRGGHEDVFFISVGFLDVGRDQQNNTVVTVLADTGEHVADIDEARAEETRREAERQLQLRESVEEYADATARLERSLARIRVAELGRRRRSNRDRRPPA